MQFQTSDLVYIIPSIFIALSIHEAMHGFVAYWLGDTTAKDMGRLTFNPLKHIDIYTTILLPIVLILFGAPPILAAKPVPFNPARVKFDEYGAALVGIAGPVTNFVLAGISGLILRFSTTLPVIAVNFLFIFAAINVGYFIFNMIPLPPLDGSRLLYAFAPEWLQEIMIRIERTNFMIILAVLILLLPLISPTITYLEAHVLHFIIGPSYPL